MPNVDSEIRILLFHEGTNTTTTQDNLILSKQILTNHSIYLANQGCQSRPGSD